jgi:regulator of nonsense transcripts 1
MKHPSWRDSARALLKELAHLNDSQRAAVAAALVRTCTLWQGPPGTGKTRTLLGFLELVCRMADTPERRQQLGPMLAVADTNAAADNLLQGMLSRGIAAVRVGQPAKVRPELRHVCLDALAEGTAAGRRSAVLRDKASRDLALASQAHRQEKISAAEWRQAKRESSMLWAQADRGMAEAAQAVLRAASVVVATCTAAGEARLQELSFRVVVVDEATQATEPSTLVPLLKGAECVVFAGDHKQLPPTVISQQALQ